MLERISIANIPIHLFTIETLHETVKETIETKSKKVFFHANARLVELANTKHKWLLDLYNNRDTFVMCDGAGIQFGATLTRQPIPIKIPYNTWVWDLVKFLSKNGYSIYLLGSNQDTLQKASKNLKAHAPELRVVGHHHGYFSKDPESEENQKLVKTINNCKPDVLMVGFGMPIQEKWVGDNIHRLNVPAVFTCGGAFDFISGNKIVAPYLVRKLYLEWLFRFTLEPVRLFSRATISIVKYIIIVLAKRSPMDNKN